MTIASKFGVQQQLALAVFIAVLLAALMICTTLFFFSQQRLYGETGRRSEEMVQAASLAFSRALAAKDEVLLDAFLHELQSRKDLAIVEAYVIDSGGRVVAHSRTEEYGKRYPVPPLLDEKRPSSYSEVQSQNESFLVTSLLQFKERAIGALVVTFTTASLTSRLRSEMYWIIGATVPILLLSGFAVMGYARGIVSRLKRLKEKAHAIGHGDWATPVAIGGADEIAQLASAFNQMQADLAQLREQEHASAGTILALNRDLKQQLATIERLKEQLAAENAVLRQQLQAQEAPGEIIGASGGLRTLIEQARQVAPLPITVLIAGESGTGKELLATYLHEASPRSQGPLIKVNCAALPVTLIESELFGHVKGAFTGAIAQKKGKFELAHGGTLILDEVGELPLEAQAKLLRALQQGEIARVGSDHPISVDVRVIAATNRVLADEVARGKFREDLYYRLKVVELVCPPLRERMEDLPTLAQHFIEIYRHRLDKPVVGIAPSALRQLHAYHWPGNIRELEHMVARAVALATTQVLGTDDFILPVMMHDAPRTASLGATSFEQLLALSGLKPGGLGHNGWERLFDACERICLEAVLQSAKNQKVAAATLGITETRLHRLLRKHELGRRNFEFQDEKTAISEG
jgi:transcriptional regulator with GAF, ATPase, and Fis domain